MKKISLSFISIILLSSICFAEEEKFSTSIYNRDKWNIFLYLCEKTAECLNVENGWSGFDKERGDNKVHCFLHGTSINGKDKDIFDNIEELQTLFAKCRANSLKLLEDK